jgi:hypothetical protein
VSTLKACAEGAGLRVKALRTTTHASRLIWAASRIIQREGAMPGAILPKLGRSLRFERKVFQFGEYLLTGLRRDAGEEILMIATRARG